MVKHIRNVKHVVLCVHRKCEIKQKKHTKCLSCGLFTAWINGIRNASELVVLMIQHEKWKKGKNNTSNNNNNNTETNRCWETWARIWRSYNIFKYPSVHCLYPHRVHVFLIVYVSFLVIDNNEWLVHELRQPTIQFQSHVRSPHIINNTYTHTILFYKLWNDTTDLINNFDSLSSQREYLEYFKLI